MIVNVIINVSIDDNVKYDRKRFSKIVQKILYDKRGWSRKGYNFIFVSSSEFDTIKPKNKKTQLKIKLRLSTNDTIAKECEFDENEKLSCYNPMTYPDATICINYTRWMDGSVYSKLPLSKYRIYVINHEIGHALGRGHVTSCVCKTCPVPVMMQQTLSIGNCLPNPWPLDDE